MTNKSGLTGISFMQSPVIPGSAWGCIDWEYKLATQEEKETCTFQSLAVTLSLCFHLQWRCIKDKYSQKSSSLIISSLTK